MVPEVIRLLLSPLLTTLVGALLLFTVIGPVGRGLSSGITPPIIGKRYLKLIPNSAGSVMPNNTDTKLGIHNSLILVLVFRGVL